MIVIQLGSNIGDRYENIRKAIKLISRCSEIMEESPIYETSAWGNTEQQNFYNLLLIIRSQLSPYRLMSQLISIEAEMGRVKSEHWGPRIIDLDIIFYCNKIIFSPDLEIPHRWMHKRRFILEPLAELSPHFVHPLLNKTVQHLLNDCTDEGKVKRIN